MAAGHYETSTSGSLNSYKVCTVKEHAMLDLPEALLLTDCVQWKESTWASKYPLRYNCLLKSSVFHWSNHKYCFANSERTLG